MDEQKGFMLDYDGKLSVMADMDGYREGLLSEDENLGTITKDLGLNYPCGWVPGGDHGIYFLGKMVDSLPKTMVKVMSLAGKISAEIGKDEAAYALREFDCIEEEDYTGLAWVSIKKVTDTSPVVISVEPIHCEYGSYTIVMPDLSDPNTYEITDYPEERRTVTEELCTELISLIPECVSEALAATEGLHKRSPIRSIELAIAVDDKGNVPTEKYIWGIGNAYKSYGFAGAYGDVVAGEYRLTFGVGY